MGDFKRVFLITVDCLRADYVGCIGGGSLTPNIDSLAEKSMVFTRAFANGPGTNQSFPAILTSTYFLMHGGMRLLPYCTTLAEVLRRHGFKTSAFNSNAFLSRILGWSRGFGEFYDFMEKVKSPSGFVAHQQEVGVTGMITRFAVKALGAKSSPQVQRFLKKIYYKFHGLDLPYLDGKRLNDHVISWLGRNRNEKLFLWMHYMDPHYPYVPPVEYLVDFTSREEAFNYNLSANYNDPSTEEVTTFKKLYEGEVRYLDACVGDLLSYLENEGLYENSLILFTADHGHAFMEHGRFGHAYDILYNEVIHVPLILFGLDESKKIDVEVQLLDIPPTILDLLGIRKASSFMGGSFFDAKDNCATIFSESAKPDLINLRYDVSKKAVSCIKGKTKLIINELQGTTELYNIDKDFQERNNILESEKDLYSELASLVKDHLSDVKQIQSKIESKGFEANKIKERLRQLGYIG